MQSNKNWDLNDNIIIETNLGLFESRAKEAMNIA